MQLKMPEYIRAVKDAGVPWQLKMLEYIDAVKDAEGISAVKDAEMHW